MGMKPGLTLTSTYEFGQLRDFKELYVLFNKDNTVRNYSFNSR